MQDSDRSLSNLLCGEDQLSEVCSPDSEYIEMLLQKEETVFQSNRNNASLAGEDSRLKCARVDAIKWILHTRAIFGLHFSTVYLSLIYFHRFLSRKTLDTGKLWPIRLLSVACLSLSAKMEECKAPALSEYQVEEYNFEAHVIQRMELLVLNTLEWKMTFTTPFVYLSYFIDKFCPEFRTKELINRAVELILAAMEEINVLEHRPSIIAAAAILVAYDCQLTNKMLEIKINEVPRWGSVEKEHILSCFSLFKKIGLKSKMSKFTTSPDCTSTHSSSTTFLENSTITSASGNKRRLVLINGDQHCPVPKAHKS